MSEESYDSKLIDLLLIMLCGRDFKLSSNIKDLYKNIENIMRRYLEYICEDKCDVKFISEDSSEYDEEYNEILKSVSYKMTINEREHNIHILLTIYKGSARIEGSYCSEILDKL
jgi:hypothetical protein